jgi:Tol biopolymer transport system component
MCAKIAASLLFALLVFCSCRDDGNTVNGKPPCPPLLTVPTPPYSGPIWHPSGQFIGFNHVPETSITYPYGEHCQGDQHFNTDSMGFWLINPDGTNMRRVLPYPLAGASWSSDGEWIAFTGRGENIHKMHFTGVTFDTTVVTNLNPHMHGSYVPAWSPDDQWIAFSYPNCSGTAQCGVWVISPSVGYGGPNPVAHYGNYPDWHPTNGTIIYVTNALTVGGTDYGDSLWTCMIDGSRKRLLSFLQGAHQSNQYPKYSPTGLHIAFVSHPQSPSTGNLWMMDTTGSNIRQLTTGGVDMDFGTAFSWSPDGSKIVYTRYHDRWTYDNGTLWILNIATGISTQLTFNGTQTVNRGGDRL